MRDQQPANTGSGANEGEGNRTAARRYNKEQQRFAQSGGVADAASEAVRALDSDEKQELERAEATGKSHIAEEDPGTGGSDEYRRELVRARAYEIWEQAGCPEGRHDEHWAQAERELGLKVSEPAG
jgi:hypothetical protein